MKCRWCPYVPPKLRKDGKPRNQHVDLERHVSCEHPEEARRYRHAKFLGEVEERQVVRSLKTVTEEDPVPVRYQQLRKLNKEIDNG